MSPKTPCLLLRLPETPTLLLLSAPSSVVLLYERGHLLYPHLCPTSPQPIVIYVKLLLARIRKKRFPKQQLLTYIYSGVFGTKCIF
jgi:hypothetical protein